jgi:hypothetical protein
VLIVLPFIFIICFAGLLYLLSQMKKQYVHAILVGILILTVVFYGVLMYEKTYTDVHCHNTAIEESIVYLSEYIDGRRITSNIWPWYGYGLNVPASFTWTHNLTELYLVEDPQFFVYSPQEGEYYPQSVFDENLKSVKNFSDSCGVEVFVYEQ